MSHLQVLIDGTVFSPDSITFTVLRNGSTTGVTCTIPSKGKGDFCEAGDKNQCVLFDAQDSIAIQADPSGSFFPFQSGSTAGFGSGPRMSWVAKLDMFATSCVPVIPSN